MKRRIYKYVIDTQAMDRAGVTVDMPEGAQILSTAFQGDDLCVWAGVNVDQPMKPRRFRVFGTGHDIHVPLSHLQFIGTAFHHAGLVMHVFADLKG